MYDVILVNKKIMQNHQIIMKGPEEKHRYLMEK